jgi:hypothetical protein
MVEGPSGAPNFWQGGDGSGFTASPDLLGDSSQWHCQLALDINPLQLSSGHDGTQPGSTKEPVPVVTPPLGGFVQEE